MKEESRREVGGNPDPRGSNGIRRRRAAVFMHGERAGTLAQEGLRWRFRYREGYRGPPVSLTMPVRQAPYAFDSVPAFFDGLLPEGVMLEGLLRARKLDRGDIMGQLLAVGKDLVGAVTIEAIEQTEQEGLTSGETGEAGEAGEGAG